MASSLQLIENMSYNTVQYVDAACVGRPHGSTSSWARRSRANHNIQTARDIVRIICIAHWRAS